MFNSQDDPSGNALRARAAQYKSEFNRIAQENGRRHGNLVSFGGLGPLQDPNWDAMFQSWDEAGVEKAGDNSIGVAREMYGAGAPFPSTYDPQYQRSAVVESGPSRQLNSRLHPSVEAIRRAARTR